MIINVDSLKITPVIRTNLIKQLNYFGIQSITTYFTIETIDFTSYINRETNTKLSSLNLKILN
jgi:hypothetical protein